MVLREQQKLRPSRIREKMMKPKMQEIKESFELMNKLCGTNITIDDIDDTFISDIEEKKKIVYAIDKAKAAVELDTIKKFMDRLDSIKNK